MLVIRRLKLYNNIFTVDQKILVQLLLLRHPSSYMFIYLCVQHQKRVKKSELGKVFGILTSLCSGIGLGPDYVMLDCSRKVFKLWNDQTSVFKVPGILTPHRKFYGNSMCPRFGYQCAHLGSLCFPCISVLFIQIKVLNPKCPTKMQCASSVRLK